MKKKRIIYHIRPIKLPKINYKPAIFFMFMFVGLITGVICMKYGVDSLVQLASDVFDNLRLEKTAKGIIEFFFTDFFSSFCFMFAAFTIGLCAIGIPFLPLIPLIKGIYLGALGGYMYMQYGISGIGYCALTVYPGAALMIAALIYGCSESMSMSADICGILVNNTKALKNVNSMKLYSIRYTVLIGIILISAIINTLFFKLFSGYFSFS